MSLRVTFTSEVNLIDQRIRSESESSQGALVSSSRRETV